MLSPQNPVGQQFLEVNNFSGGMTDNIIGAPQNQFEEARNFYIEKYGDLGKLLIRPGLRPDDTTNTRVPTNVRLCRIFDLEQQIFQISSKKLYYNNSGFTQVVGPSGNPVFNAGDDYAMYSVTKWNKHAILTNNFIPSVMKVFKNGLNWYCHNLGLPALASTPTCTGTGSGKSYIYAFKYTYQYVSNGVTLQEDGQTVYSGQILNTNDPATTNIAISAIPVLSNGVTENYDTANIKVNIYRTQNNGSVFYYLGQVANGTTTFTDNVADTTAINNAILYSSGNVPDHEKPPSSKFVHQTNDILCLGYVKEGATTYPNRARFSNRYSPWSCPGSFYEDFDEEIKGISSCSNYPIYFCDKKVYRIEGYFLPDGSGGVVKKIISETAGCVSENSIVQTEGGVFWAGNDGFYWTDGYKVVRLSSDINITYKSLYNKQKIAACYDSKYELVLFSVQEVATSTENDLIFVCHLKAGISETTPFTQWDGGYNRTNFSPTCLHYYLKTYHGESNGYLLYHDFSALDDIKISVGSASTTWTNLAIIYSLNSPAFDFGTDSYRKWVPWISVVAENASALSLQIYSNNDNSGVLKALKEVVYSGTIAWGDTRYLWGDLSIRWNYFPFIAFKRRMPVPGARCMLKQVIFTNSYTLITSSTILGAGTFNGSAKTVTISGSWSVDLTDYYVSCSADNYVNQYKVLSIAGSTITVQDSGGTLPTGSYSWKVYGYKKGEVLKLQSYSIIYGMTSPSLQTFRPST